MSPCLVLLFNCPASWDRQLFALKKTCNGKGGSDVVFGVCACGVRCPGLNRPPQNMLYELMSCALVLVDSINLRVCVCVCAHVNQFCLGFVCT